MGHSGDSTIWLDACESDSVNFPTFPINIANNQWHFIAYTYNYQTNTAIAHVDSYVESITPPGALNWYQGSSTAVIGACHTCGGTQPPWRGLNGLIANIQIYNTSLSSSQIQALYQEGIGGAPIDLQHLVGWWPLNGNANNYSGNGNNGQATEVTYVSNWWPGYTPP
ncbi:MAG: LamG-like jellyroll fold domain-containing protein [Candidatus Micrarchaeia archaeon]